MPHPRGRTKKKKVADRCTTAGRQSVETWRYGRNKDGKRMNVGEPEGYSGPTPN